MYCNLKKDIRKIQWNIPGGSKMKKNIFLTQLGDYFDVYLPNIRRASPNTIAAY